MKKSGMGNINFKNKTMKLVRIVPLAFLFFSLVAGFYMLSELKTMTKSTKEHFEENLELMKQSHEQLIDSLKKHEPLKDSLYEKAR